MAVEVEVELVLLIDLALKRSAKDDGVYLIVEGYPIVVRVEVALVECDVDKCVVQQIGVVEAATPGILEVVG